MKDANLAVEDFFLVLSVLQNLYADTKTLSEEGSEVLYVRNCSEVSNTGLTGVLLSLLLVT